MENGSRNPRRRGRGDARQAQVTADAFRLREGAATRPGFGFLSDADIEELKTRALALLSDYGVTVIHPEAVRALCAQGAKPGTGADRFLLPRELVEEALAATPKQVNLHGKSPGRLIALPRRDAGFVMRTGTGAHGYVDPETSAYRNLDLKAVREIGAVASGLDQVGFVAHPFVAGVPEITADVHSFATMVNHTDKHCWVQPYSKESVEFLMQIAAVAAGGKAALRARPLASCITCSFSPLEFKYMDTEVILQAGRHGLPIHACSLPSAGGTAPLSTAGLVLMAAAEILAMVTIAHVLAPGTPVIATPLMFTLDMRTGSALQSSPETLQAASMAVQLMKRGFGLVTHTYGAGSDTPDADMQSMAERALLAQTVVLSGVDILGGVGQLECATVHSPVQAVLDNEIGAMLRRFIERPEIDGTALNWEEVAAKPAGGHFLDSPHTLALCRRQHQPDVFLRMGRDDYEASGRRTAFDQARDKALSLIRAAPEEGLLSADQRREIEAIRRDADRIILAKESATQVI
ncbi:trimethylamine methyltransferase family protein [Shimia sp.]|uniref:trimethylamine methyltransferase family protein n=1 Tax=Shimia sp. TaxID=1954381 RepID=UPI0035674218